jgi:ribosome-associated protein YbcJ (S4-like RNA binding protein)
MRNPSIVNLELNCKIKLWKLLTGRAYFLTKREAKDLIILGLVSVNGITETRLDAKVSFGDIVEFEGQKIILE